MGYIGIAPTAAPLTSADLEDGLVTAAKIATDAVETAKVKDVNVTAGKLAATQDLSTKTITLPASVAGLGTGITNSQLAGSIDVTSKITGIVPTTNLGSGSASASTYLAGDQSYKALSEYDDDAVVNDIATLALHQATNANAAKYNLVNTNVDQFEDSTGVASFTDCTRDAAGEYVSTIVNATGIDANTVMMLHFDTIPAATIVDSSDNSGDITITKSGSAATSAVQKKFGDYSYSGEQATADYLYTGNLSSGLTRTFPTTGDFTVDFWFYQTTQEDGNRLFSIGNNGTPASGGEPIITWANNSGGPSTINNHSVFGSFNPPIAGSTNFAEDVWIHGVIQRTGTKLHNYINGKIYWITTNQTLLNGQNLMTSGDNVFIGARSNSTTEYFRGFIDEFRVSNIARYDSTAANDTTVFTPPTAAYAAEVSSATGNFVSTATTANASVTTMGAVILYKNEDGTNALNTDIIIEVSADGGSNYTTATLTAGGTFSTGVLQAVANDVTVTAGTSIQYRISFANQSAGVKEAQIYGVSLMY